MPQSLTLLPKTADIPFGLFDISIREHRAVNAGRLLGGTVDIITHGDSDRESLEEFEKHGISFEAAIEYYVWELEKNSYVFAYLIDRYYDDTGYRKVDVEKEYKFFMNSTSSDAGKKIADQLVEKIRSCENWGELYDEMHMNNRFQKDMKDRILGELKQCRRIC